MMNRFLAGPMVLAFCLLIPLPTYAQDTPTPEKKALIKELLRLINATGNSEAMTNQMLDKMREPFVMLVSQGLLKEIPQQKLSPAEQRRLKSEAEESAQRILARVRIEIPKRVNINEIFDQIWFEMYSKHFTEEELKELVNLYKSPTAQKLARLFPQLLSESSPKLEELIRPALTQLLGELLTEEKKRLMTR